MGQMTKIKLTTEKYNKTRREYFMDQRNKLYKKKRRKGIGNRINEKNERLNSARQDVNLVHSDGI
jgi:hypothetical protein